MMLDTHLALPLVNVSSSPVADENLRPVEQLEVVQQEGHSDEGQGASQDGWAWSLLDAKKSNHDDLEEEHCCDDVLEDLHPQLHHHKELREAQYRRNARLQQNHALLAALQMHSQDTRTGFGTEGSAFWLQDYLQHGHCVYKSSQCCTSCMTILKLLFQYTLLPY